MTTDTSGAIARDLDRLLGGGSIAGRDDAELLDRFARRGDESAFEALVLRHGPRVRGLCRRLVGDPHAAEDASQATWLVLARRARSVRLDRGGSLGPWLHGVAVRVARRARAVAARRRDWEIGGDALADRPAASGPDPAELERWAILHEEVGRLPDVESAALVLCYWEGLTHRQAAERLGQPSGTVNVRVKRARDRLRDRLARRGIAGAVGLTLLDQIGGPAPAAPAAASTCGSIVGNVAADRLAAGVIRTMTISKLLKIGAAAFVALSLSAGGLMASARQHEPAKAGDDPPPAAKVDPPDESPTPPNGPPAGENAAAAPDAHDLLLETLREAAKAAEAIEDPRGRATRLAEIAPAQADAGDREAARETYRLAVRAVKAIPEISQPIPEGEGVGFAVQMSTTKQRLYAIVGLLNTIAQGQAEAGYFEDALATAREMPRGQFPNGLGQASTTFQIVTIQARKGDFDGARETLDSIEVAKDLRLSKLGEIAGLQARAGQVEEAKAWIVEIADPTTRSVLLSNVAEGIRQRMSEPRPEQPAR